MRPTPRLYLLIVFAPIAALFSGTCLLNKWVDPLKRNLYQRLTTHTYALPALLAELERPAASERDIDRVLVGTSRTRRGHDTRKVPQVINLGIEGADDRIIDNLLVGLLQTSTRSHIYFLDTMGYRRDPRRQLEGSSLHYLLSGDTTKLSLRKIAGQMQARPTPDNDAYPGDMPPRVPTKADQDLARKTLNLLRDNLPVGPGHQTEIEARIQRITELRVPHDALVIYYDGPHSLISLSDPIIRDALQARTRLWHQVVTKFNAAQPRSSDVSSAAVERPRVTVAYVSYATPTDWGEPVAAEVWNAANWSDPLHFKPAVGQALLDRLIKDAARIQPTTTAP